MTGACVAGFRAETLPGTQARSVWRLSKVDPGLWRVNGGSVTRG
jgi:hypothetical protein